MLPYFDAVGNVETVKTMRKHRWIDRATKAVGTPPPLSHLDTESECRPSPSPPFVCVRVSRPNITPAAPNPRNPQCQRALAILRHLPPLTPESLNPKLSGQVCRLQSESEAVCDIAYAFRVNGSWRSQPSASDHRRHGLFSPHNPKPQIPNAQGGGPRRPTP